MMKNRSIFREAWRNSVSGTSRVVLFALLFTAVTAGCVTLDLSNVRGIEQAALDYQRAGASVSLVEAPGQIDGASCDALAGVRGIRAAGALRNNDDGLPVAALPSGPLPIVNVTPGFPAVVHTDWSHGPGLILSDQVVKTMNRGPGDALTLQHSSVPITGEYAYPDDGRRSGLGYSVLSPSSTDDAPFDECWADIWPSDPETSKLLALALIPKGKDADTPSFQQLNTRLGAEFDATTRFYSRNTQGAMWVSGALGLAIGYLFIRTRRMQHASAVHAGVRHRDLAMILAIEAAAWIVPSALLAGSVIAWFIATDPRGDFASSAVLGGRIITIAVVGAVIGLSVAIASIREKALFRYFKDR
jgi:hypothetical protein